MKRAIWTGALGLVIALSLTGAGFGIAASGGEGGEGNPGTTPSASGGGGRDQTADDARDEAEEDGGVHGGPIERFHQAGACGLTSLGQLPGNWTHGDYVSAVAALDDPTLIVEAAHSACGKPQHAGGPPFGVGQGRPEGVGNGRPDEAGDSDPDAA